MDQKSPMQGTQNGNTSQPNSATVSTGDGVASSAAASTTSSRPVAPEQPTMPVASPMSAAPVAPAKKHTGLIVGIIIAILAVLAAVGAAVWFFCFYNNPEKVAYDAITGFLKQPNTVTDGTVIAHTELENGNLVDVTIFLDNKSNGQSGEGSIQAKVIATDKSNQEPVSYEYEVSASSIITQDGTIYLRVDKLVELVDKLMDDMEVDTEEFGSSFEVVYELIGNIDGEWWEISVPDIIDELVDDNSIARPMKKFYACVIDASHQNVGEQLADVYSTNRFLNIEKAEGGLFGGSSTYLVTFDTDKMASFMNSTLDIEAGQEAEKCAEELADSLGGNYNIAKTSIKASDLKKVFDKTKITMEVSNFGHELQSISVEVLGLDEGSSISAGFGFTHTPVEVTAPADYRPIMELLEEIVEMVLASDEFDFDYPVSWNDPDDYEDWDFDEDDWNLDDNDWEFL